MVHNTAKIKNSGTNVPDLVKKIITELRLQTPRYQWCIRSRR